MLIGFEFTELLDLMLNLTKCLKYLKLKCQAEDTNLFLFQRRHRTIAHGTTCQICQYTTFTERETVLHTNKKHAQNNEIGESICSLCSKTFQSVKSLTTHIRIDHFNSNLCTLLFYETILEPKIIFGHFLT